MLLHIKTINRIQSGGVFLTCQPCTDYIITAPLTVTFTDLSQGIVTGWDWIFGDGSTATVASPGHVYNTPGVYTVTLSVNISQGDTLVKTTYITVTGEVAEYDHFVFLPAVMKP